MSNESENMQVLMRVAAMAAVAHKNQNRKDGGNYIRHPLGVAALIEPQYATLENMCAAICHDILEDVPEELDATLEEMKLTFGEGFRINDEEPWDYLSSKGKLTHLLAACLNGDMRSARSITRKVMELTVVWPQPDSPSWENPEEEKVAKNAWKIERLSGLSKDGLAIAKADKTFNMRHPIPGRDPAEEAEKCQKYLDRVDELMASM